MEQHPESINWQLAGLDEAGRGCLAGPVVAAAVILPKDCQITGLNDSKKLTEKKRLFLREEIQNTAVSWCVSFVDQKEIDEINILRASIAAMHRSIDFLEIAPSFLIVDGNKFLPYKDIPYETVIKGDGKYLSIAAASILAKTYRDDYMKGLHQLYPEYNWAQNKAYPTKAHLAAIHKYGLSVHHRKSYKPCIGIPRIRTPYTTGGSF